jgi:hypothetical protein
MRTYPGSGIEPRGNDSRFVACVLQDHACRVGQCTSDDRYAEVLVEVGGRDGLGVWVSGDVEHVGGVGGQCERGFEQRYTAARQDAFLDNDTRGIERIIVRALLLPTSTSLLHLTLITAIPHPSFANHSCNLSNLLVVGSATMLRICLRAWMESLDSSPLEMVVSSLVIVMEPVEPRRLGVSRSSLMSNSSVYTVRPVRMTRSPRMDLRLPPKPGALTSVTWSWPRDTVNHFFFFPFNIANSSPDP